MLTSAKLTVLQSLIQAVWETGIQLGVYILWLPKITFQVFFIQLYFNKKYVEVAINDFTMHLIFWNDLEYRIADRKEKQWDKEVKAKEESINESVFIHLST